MEADIIISVGSSICCISSLSSLLPVWSWWIPEIQVCDLILGRLPPVSVIRSLYNPSPCSRIDYRCVPDTWWNEQSTLALSAVCRTSACIDCFLLYRGNAAAFVRIPAIGSFCGEMAAWVCVCACYNQLYVFCRCGVLAFKVRLGRTRTAATQVRLSQQRHRHNICTAHHLCWSEPVVALVFQLP